MTTALGWYSAVAALAILIFAAVSSHAAQPMWYAAIALGASVAAFGGILRNRPERRAFWLGLATALALFATSDVSDLLLTGTVSAFEPIPEALAFAAYASILVALFGLDPSRLRLDPSTLIDVLIVIVAAALVIWLIFLEPAAGAIRKVDDLAALAFPVLDVVVLFVLLPPALRPGQRSPSLGLLLVAFVLLPLADTLGGMAELRSSSPGSGVYAIANLVGYLCIGAAALHPSMQSVGPSAAAGEADRRSRERARFVLTTLALLVPPVLLVARAFEAIPHSDVPAIALGAVVLTGLVIVRLNVDQRSLRRSYGLLANAEAVGHFGSFAWEAATERSAWSDELWRITGLDRGATTLDNETVYRVVHPDDRDRVRDAIVTTRRTCAPLELEFRIVLPDGAMRHAHLTGRAEPAPDESAARIAGVLADVSRRAAAEEAQAQLATAIEQTADAIWVERSDGTITYVNRAFSDLYGYGAEEVIGRSSIALDDHREPRPWESVDAAVARGETWAGPLSKNRSDGSSVEVQATISPVRDAAGNVVGRVHVARDVSRERQLEQRLREVARLEAVGQLAGGIAHDFNNLMTAVRGYAELILSQAAAADALVRADLEEIIGAADRASRLTRQLLAFSRQQILQPRVLDPAEVMAAIAPMLRRLIGEQIEMRVVAGDSGRIRADPSQLEQVIVNLAVNARDAMPDGGQLTIEVSSVELDEDYVRTHPETASGQYVMLAVSDTGFGMAPATLRRMFEPFFTTKEPGKGTGMGLATVYGIVKQSRGSINVYSEEGHGTSFKIYLPRVDEPLSATIQFAAVPARGGSETILVVEDDAAVRGFAARALEAHGYFLLVAADPAEALAISAAPPRPIDLLLTDVVMPGMSGHELADLLTADQPRLRVVYVSGYTDNSVIRQGVPEHGVTFLAKPYSAAALVATVRRAIDEEAP